MGSAVGARVGSTGGGVSVDVAVGALWATAIGSPPPDAARLKTREKTIKRTIDEAGTRRNWALRALRRVQVERVKDAWVTMASSSRLCVQISNND